MTDIADSGEIARRTTDLLLDSIGEIVDGFALLTGPAGKVAKVFSGLAGVLDGSNIAGSLIRLTELSLNAASAVDELSRQTGIGTDRLQELQFAFEVNGLNFGQLDKALTNLQTSAGLASLNFDESADNVFERLGLKRLGLKRLGLKGELGQFSTEELFGEVLRGLSTVENKFEQAALAAQIFGRDVGPKLLPFVQEGPEGLARLGDQARSFGAVWDRHVLQNAAETNREFRGLKIAIDTELAESFVALGSPLNVLAEDFLSKARAAAEVVDEFRSIEGAPTQELERRLVDLAQKIAKQEQNIDTEIFFRQVFTLDRLQEDLQELETRRDRILSELETRVIELPQSDQRSLLIDGATNLVQFPGQFSPALVGGNQFASLDPSLVGIPDNVVPFPNLEQAEQGVIDFAAVARKAFEDYANSATDVSGQVEAVIGGALMNMEDALVQFVQTGKLDFSKLVDAMIADLIRLAVRAAILGPLARAIGAAFNPAGASGFLETAALRTSVPGGIGGAASGARFVVPGAGGIDSLLVAFRATPGEVVTVMPQDRFRTGEAGGSVVNVNVVNNSGGEVATRERPNGFGGRDIEVLIGEAVARDLRGGGPAFRAVRDTFGAGARPITR